MKKNKILVDHVLAAAVAAWVEAMGLVLARERKKPLGRGGSLFTNVIMEAK